MIRYKDAGVNIEEGYKAVSLIKKHAAKTMISGVMNDIGSFAGMFALPKMENPILVSGTDGVGTKLKIAFHTKKHDTVGIDCVAMCVNDILCHGATPLFFLDYIACGKLQAEVAADLVKGVADGCIQAGCALLGGETAEMPGFYQDGEYDIAGFAVGVVEKDKIIDGSRIKDGDALIGIASSGVHSNGFSLVRKMFQNLEENFNGDTLGNTLLTPTKIYVKTVHSILKQVTVKGMAHITGGGFYENIPRMFKEAYTAVIDRNSFSIPEVFQKLSSMGIDEKEMFNTFNMGIGFVLCVEQKDVEKTLQIIDSCGEKGYRIGRVAAGGEGLCLK